jgi:predicted nucleotidyltransferase
MTTFTEDTTYLFPGKSEGSVAYGDYDNDGDLDILLSGGGNVRLYNNNEGHYSQDTNNNFPYFSESSVDFGDYDNDGDVDILLSGYCSSGRVAQIYKNSEGLFSEDTSISLHGVRYGSSKFGDYDNDGDLDILLSGNDDNDNLIAKLYRNSSGTFTEVTDISLPQVYHSDVAFGDYDNDGDLDFIITGMDSDNKTIASLYNNSNGHFYEDTNVILTDVYQGSVTFGDYDNDNDLDILLTGYSKYLEKRIAKIYRNNLTTPNTPPNAPTNLNAMVSDQTVLLSWSAASDTETITNTGLTYNLQMGTTPNGIDIISPMALPLSNGYRQIPARGHIQTLTQNIKDLDDGIYYWRAQAIDTSFAGSNFSDEKWFVIGSHPAIFPVEDQTIYIGSTISSMSIFITDTLSAPCDLKITFSSSNTDLIPTHQISYTCSENSYYLSITPVSNQYGTSIITLNAEDSDHLISTKTFQTRPLSLMVF